MDLHARLMPVAMSEAHAKPYFKQLVSAVNWLHANGTVHNDIKPSNIMLSKDDKPILIDFGFAKHYDEDDENRFMSNSTWGTPEYLDPARSRGEWHDERLGDIYSLGVTLYETIVGRTPFEETETEEFLTTEALKVSSVAVQYSCRVSL